MIIKRSLNLAVATTSVKDANESHALNIVFKNWNMFG